MGSIRLLLAIAVTLGHIPIYWQQPVYSGCLFAYYIVQIFFVISGFYMALVLTEKYKPTHNGIKEFYFNRYMRLAPAFWLVGIVTLLLTILYPQVFPLGEVIQFGLNIDFTAQNICKLLVLISSNILLFGQDIPAFFGFAGKAGQDYLIIPQGWTLGAEIIFYLLSPYLIKLRTNILIVLCVASFALRFVFYAYELPFWPWQQRFFGCEIMFFLFGILSYRLYINFNIQDVKFGKLISLFLTSCFVPLIMGGDYIFPNLIYLTASKSLLIGLFTLFTLPFMFSLTRYSRLDRLLGELSYPVYLWHICLGYWLQDLVGKWDGWLLVVVSLLFALPVVLCLELPLQERRNRKLGRYSSADVILADELG